MIIFKSEVEAEKEKLHLNIKNLRDSVNEFNTVITELDEVIAGLRVVANTCGGHAKTDKIAKIADVEFNKTNIESIALDVENITTNTDIVRTNIL